MVGKNVLPSPTDNILLCRCIPLELSNATVQIPAAINILALFLPIAFSTTEKVMIDESSVVAVELYLKDSGIYCKRAKEMHSKRSHEM